MLDENAGIELRIAITLTKITRLAGVPATPKGAEIASVEGVIDAATDF
jgi:hypothetical protein